MRNAGSTTGRKGGGRQKEILEKVRFKRAKLSNKDSFANSVRSDLIIGLSV